MWSLRELRELLGEWVIAAWQNREHYGLRDPLHPQRAFTPNEKYAAMAEAVGYVPVALTADDYVELLPARWHAVNAYGVKVNRRAYDGEELNPFRQQRTAGECGSWTRSPRAGATSAAAATRPPGSNSHRLSRAGRTWHGASVDLGRTRR